MKKLTRKAPPPALHLDSPKSSSAAPPVQYYGLVTNCGPMEYECYSLIFNFGGRVLTQQPDGQFACTIDSPQFIDGLQHLQDLDYRYHVAAPGIGAFTQDQSWSLWRDSRSVAATIQGGWIINAMNTANRDILQTNQDRIAAGRPSETILPYKWALAAPPTRDLSTTPILASSGLGTFAVFKQKDSHRRDLAAKLAMFLVRGEGQKILREECVYPSRKSAGNPFADDPMIGPVFALFPDAIMSPLIPGGERIDKVLQQEIQKALLTDPSTGKPQATPAQAARAAKFKIDAVLDRAKRRFSGTAE
jgi:ABC-type glycerol-3-phosphate transport system substrate-binding protein